MADYKFDGRYLRSSGRQIAVTDGKRIHDTNGHFLGDFDGKTIRDAHGNYVAKFDGSELHDQNNRRIGTIADARRMIDGTGGGTIMALWFLVLR